MLQIERELRGSRIARLRIDLQTTQDGLLEPWRHGRIALTRRHGVPPQSPTPIVRALWLPERTLASRQKIEDHAEREQVAARIAAVAKDLFGRDIGSRTDRSFRFLLH